MTSEQSERFEMLRSGQMRHALVMCGITTGWISLYTTLSLAPLRRYTDSLRRRVPCPEGQLSRYELEGFMSLNDFLTRKWMGARLGMSEPSLNGLLLKLVDLGMQSSRYDVGSGLVVESLAEDLLRHIPGLRFRTFADHTAFCEQLHAELQKAIGLKIEPLYCATSGRLQENPRRFAAHFRLLDFETAQYEAFDRALDFRKPPNDCPRIAALNWSVLKTGKTSIHIALAPENPIIWVNTSVSSRARTMADHTSRDQSKRASFSDGIDKVVEIVRPHGAPPETAFPSLPLDVTDTRRRSGDNLHEWFKRLVDKYCQGDPTQIRIEDNIALMAKFKWDKLEKNRLIYASVPILVTESTLEEYYLDGGRATYFRLDVDYGTLGTPFSHPLAHINVGDDDSPRFALDGGTSGNVVMDFLEFIYRNHAPRKWLQWARREWLSAGEDKQRADQFNQIVQAFRDSQFNVLRANAIVLSQIKRTPREAKDSLFDAHVTGTDREILEYPLAR